VTLINSGNQPFEGERKRGKNPSLPDGKGGVLRAKNNRGTWRKMGTEEKGRGGKTALHHRL